MVPRWKKLSLRVFITVGTADSDTRGEGESIVGNVGEVIENQRQVPAWEYPVKYAPKQPRFSRAMVCGKLFMCSGTASVLGHETIHLDDVQSQLRECLRNVQTLLESSDQQWQERREGGTGRAQ